MLLLDRTEKRDGLSIYWIIDDTTDKRVCGVCFEDGILNIHNQGIAESMIFAMNMLEAGGGDE
jgi:hypothetical protein